MSRYYEAMLPGKSYHLFNRAIGNEKLFKTDANYGYFLRKYRDHLGEVFKTYCYCLLPNHFHFLIRIGEEDLILDQYQKYKKQMPTNLPDFIMERVSNFLNSYTKSFNRLHKRKGGLFLDYTKRIAIDNDSSFSKMIHYVHANPVHHGICERIEDWQHSSYRSILSDLPTRLLRDEVIEWFGSKEQFIKFHQQPVDIKLPQDYD